ncbi:D-alanine--poly(phosphoribitol) ligase [Olsenella sp. HMSC062G07]|nr:D-alanine--poly(phosphoribitol) ligase [Olsenella sp. HMSC062G07]
MWGGTNTLLESVWWTAVARPDTPAFRSFGTPAMSYSELWDLSGVIADAIAGVRDDRLPVIVLGAKSATTVAAFLACLRSGHAYVPVDVSTPASRIEDVASQLSCGNAEGRLPLMVVTAPDAPAVTGAVTVDVSSCRVSPRLEDAGGPGGTAAGPSAPLLSDAERLGWVWGDETQYVIFTSGSTGKPKGIEVSAEDVGNFAAWMDAFPVVREGSKTFIDQACYSFDLSVYELVGALTTGGCLYALSVDAARDYARLFEELADSDAHVWVSTPPFADLCLADKAFSRELLPHLGLFLFCGDTLRHRTADALLRRFSGARVANTYGPTESTVAVTYCEIDERTLSSDAALPVGVARPGTELRVLRTDGPDGPLGEPCATGETGEIVIVGDTVAKGYFNDSAKTAFAFGEAMLADGRRVRSFRTGDLGHLDEDGMLHYEGRMGSLVKVNGFRVELGDVENHLASLDGIKVAVVVPIIRKGRVSLLRAFVVLDHATPRQADTPQAIRERLGRRIPSYMVPRSVRVIDHMPLTANAKIDRKLLMVS